MTHRQAKLLLQSYRPAGQDATDPLHAEALKLVRSDPELARWFEAEQAIDAAIGAKLREVPVPPELREEILALGIPPASGKREWRWTGIRLAAAAAVALLLTLAAIWLRASALPAFASFEKDVLRRAVAGPEHLALTSGDLPEIRQWLHARGIPGEIDLPAGLRGELPHGCRVLDWGQTKVALICFVPAGRPHVDLLVIDGARYRDFLPPKTPRFGQSGELATAVWSTGGKTYLLAARMDVEELRRFL